MDPNQQRIGDVCLDAQKWPHMPRQLLDQQLVAVRIPLWLPVVEDAAQKELAQPHT